MTIAEPIQVPRLPIEQLVRLRWQKALVDNDDNRTLAAKELHVSLRTLQRWIQEVAVEAKANNTAATVVSENLTFSGMVSHDNISR